MYVHIKWLGLHQQNYSTFFRLVAGTGWGYLVIRCTFVTEMRPKHSSGLQDRLSYIALKSRVFNAMSVKFVGNLGRTS